MIIRFSYIVSLFTENGPVNQGSTQFIRCFCTIRNTEASECPFHPETDMYNEANGIHNACALVLQPKLQSQKHGTE